MVLKKKVVESAIATGLLVAFTTTTAVTGHVVSNMSTNTKIITTAQVQSGAVVSGVIQELNTKQVSAIAKVNGVSVTSSEVNTTMTAEAGITKAVAATIKRSEATSPVSVSTADATITAAAPQTTVADTTTQVPVTETSATTEVTQTYASTESTDTQSTSTQSTSENTSTQSTTTESTTTEQPQTAQTEATTETTTVAPTESNTSSEATVVQNTDVTINSDSVAAQIAQEEAQWAAKLLPNVDQFINVRASADENSALVGKLYKGDAADVIEKGDTWTHIKSGDLDGYVMNQYCVFGTDAYNLAKQTCETEAKATTGGLRLREQPSNDASIVDLIAQGQVMTVSKDAPAVDGWITITYNNQLAYVSSQYVNVSLAVGQGVTIEEEQAQQAAEQADKAAKAVKKQQKAAVDASVDDVSLLAAVIQLEAGGEPYEGKVAVGAVIMNRVRSGRYAGSISGVIYQGGQFSTAGSVASVAAHGASASCVQAAQEAINGTDNTGGCVSFRRASSGYSGLVIGNHVFF